MNKNKEDDVTPGITFDMDEVNITTNAFGKNVMSIKLSAFVQDNALVESVSETLNKGLRIYTSPTFHMALLEALREENLQLEKKLELLEAAHRVALDQNRSMKASLSVLQVQLEGDPPEEE